VDGLAARDRRVRLIVGCAVAALVPGPEQRRFSIVTEAGTVSAVGTIFSVEITATGGAVAHVLEGAVAAITPNDDAERVQASKSLRLGRHEQEPLAAADEERAAELVRVARMSAIGPLSTVEVRANVDDARIVLDGVFLGAPPATLRVRAGRHDLEVRGPSGARMLEELQLSADEVVVKTYRFDAE
jgi:hypothetical protein